MFLCLFIIFSSSLSLFLLSHVTLAQTMMAGNHPAINSLAEQTYSLPKNYASPPPPPHPHLRPNPCTFPLRPAEIHRHQSPGSLFAFSSRFFSSASTLLSPAPDSFSLRNLQRPPVDSKAKRMRISNHTFRVLCSALSRLSVLSHTPPSCSF